MRKQHKAAFDISNDRAIGLGGPERRVIDIARVENTGARHHRQEVGMRRLTFALALFASPALAQTPNLLRGHHWKDVTSPCVPSIGKTAKG